MPNPFRCPEWKGRYIQDSDPVFPVRRELFEPVTASYRPFAEHRRKTPFICGSGRYQPNIVGELELTIPNSHLIVAVASKGPQPVHGVRTRSQ